MGASSRFIYRMRNKGPVILNFAVKGSPKIKEELSYLFSDVGRECSLEEFDSLDDPRIVPTGNIHCLSDREYDLVFNDFAELSFAEKLCKSGLFLSMHGQKTLIPYQKPWANKPSPYYPDFILYTKKKHIVIFEMKSILGMCQEENIAKYLALKRYCASRGYACSMFDRDLMTFEEYLWPLEDTPVKRYVEGCLNGEGLFSSDHLRYLLKGKKSAVAKAIRREVASIILQNPYVENRYCHDDPDLINAVKVPYPVSHKLRLK